MIITSANKYFSFEDRANVKCTELPQHSTVQLRVHTQSIKRRIKSEIHMDWKILRCVNNKKKEKNCILYINYVLRFLIIKRAAQLVVYSHCNKNWLWSFFCVIILFLFINIYFSYLNIIIKNVPLHNIVPLLVQYLTHQVRIFNDGLGVILLYEEINEKWNEFFDFLMIFEKSCPWKGSLKVDWF